MRAPAPPRRGPLPVIVLTLIAGALLAGCSSLGTLSTFLGGRFVVTEAELQQRFERRFPRDFEFGDGMATVTLSQPQARLHEDTLSLAFDMQASLAGLRLPLRGHLALESGLRFDPQSQSLYLHEPHLTRLDLPRVPGAPDADQLSRLVAMGGQDLRAAGPRAEEAMAKNDFAGFAAATADVMVKASGTIEKLLESRKRAMEQSVTTNQLMEEYQRFNAELRLPPSSTPAAAAAAAVQQQQQQQFAPAMVAASGSYSGRAPAQQQQYAPAPPKPQASQYRDGRSLLPPELHAAWAGYMATQDTTVDVAGVMERAQNVMARGM